MCIVNIGEQQGDGKVTLPSNASRTPSVDAVDPGKLVFDASNFVLPLLPYAANKNEFSLS